MTQNKEWDVGVSAVVVRDERVLFVRYAYGHRKGMWTLPGGYANHDETLDQAALRELQEEAGLTGTARGIVSVRTRTTDEGGAVFVGLHVEAQGEPHPDDSEVDAAQFFNREELLVLNPVMELSRQIALAVLAAPGVELVETGIPGRSDQTYKAYMVAPA